MKNTRILRRTRRAGLTLIELIVVLAILVALGGIAVAVAPDLIKRTHVAEHATNAQVVETAVRTNTLLSNGSIGNGFDSLVEAGGANVYGGLPGGAANYSLLTIDAADLDALNGLGLSAVVDGPATFTNATFDYAASGTPRTLAASDVLCALADGSAAETTALVAFNTALTDDDGDPLTPAPGRIVVLGVGPNCSLVGANGVMTEAPVHFGESEADRANNTYGRYVVLVELTNPGSGAGEARLLGTAVLHDDGPARASDALAEWYE